MHCVFWHLSLRNRSSLFSSLSYSSFSVGSSHIEQLFLPICINVFPPGISMTDNDHYTRGTLDNSCSFGDTITIWLLKNFIKSFCPLFLILTHQFKPCWLVNPTTAGGCRDGYSQSKHRVPHAQLGSTTRLILILISLSWISEKILSASLLKF